MHWEWNGELTIRRWHIIVVLLVLLVATLFIWGPHYQHPETKSANATSATATATPSDATTFAADQTMKIMAEDDIKCPTVEIMTDWSETAHYKKSTFWHDYFRYVLVDDQVVLQFECSGGASASYVPEPLASKLKTEYAMSKAKVEKH
ncbi:MAG: hypothetical protein WC516_02490 [Patescibacteria group bacterium]